MGLFHDFIRGKTHVLYGLIVIFGVGVWRVLCGDFLWLLVVILTTGCIVDLWAHNYPHDVNPTGDSNE